MLVVLCLTNLIGALGPEIGFDALWYHLTLPKIWLSHHKIFFLTDSTFKYSAMPLLTEMFYFLVPGKLIHYIFGLLTLVMTFKLANKTLDSYYSLLATLIMGTNLVFGWESTSAYIDLARTFFEASALYFFLDNKFYKSAISLGFAICTKLLAISSLPIFLVLLMIRRTKIRLYLGFCFLVIVIVFPWLLRAYLSTGNPIYPILSPVLTENFSSHISDLWMLFSYAADPINLIYLFTIPFIVINYKKLSSLNLLITYSFLGLTSWYFIPHAGGGRFILPYLPAFSVITASVIYILRSKILLTLALLLSCFYILYRVAANSKYLPVIFSFQSQTEFLCSRLNFNFGDYYDCDGKIGEYVKSTDRVLTLGINNLYYANFIYDPNNFDFILLREPDAVLPTNYSNWIKTYTNNSTRVTLYKKL